MRLIGDSNNLALGLTTVSALWVASFSCGGGGDVMCGLVLLGAIADRKWYWGSGCYNHSPDV